MDETKSKEGWASLMDDLARFVQLPAAERGPFVVRLREAPPPTAADAVDAIAAIHRALAQLPYVFDVRSDRWDGVMQVLLPHFVRWAAGGTTPPAVDAEAARLAGVYRNLGKDQPQRWRILQILAAVCGPQSIDALVDLFVDDPPTDPKRIDALFAQLWRQAALPVDRLFPRLFEALRHPQLGAMILELSSDLFRRGKAVRHPAAVRERQLSNLLEQLLPELDRVARRPQDLGKDPATVAQIVERSVQTASAVMDALGLIGEPESAPALRKGLSALHRRLQAEAACALARMGEEEGLEKLAALAADPAVRLRALTYLEELNHLEAAAPENRTADAVAEAEAAACLARPTQFGLSPTHLELWDKRSLLWPGGSKPVDCRLYKYHYRLPGGVLSGAAIVGPMTHALPLDFQGLTAADALALYCGWQVEHDEIRRIPPEHWGDLERDDFEAAASALAEAGFSSLRPVERIAFFGSTIWVMRGEYHDAPAAAILDAGRPVAHPLRNVPRSLQPTDYASLLIGRKILEQFNPGWSA